MTRTLNDLRRALHEEADAAAYPHGDALVAGARRRAIASRRRQIAVLGAVTAAVLVVGGVAVSRPEQRALPQPAGAGASSPATSPATATNPATNPTAGPTAPLPASQSAADARAYGIDPAVAALPMGVRVFQPDPASWPVATTQASTPEGLWLVSLPYESPDYDDAAHPGLLTVYGELLLLTPDRSRILRAYPFRGLLPQWLLVTPKAVYCGRQGDGGYPNSMVCRVDRSTGALVVVVFPGPSEFATEDYFVTDTPQALAGRPGSWRLAGSNPSSADLQHVPRLTADGLVFARDPYQPGGGRELRLDPATLK